MPATEHLPRTLGPYRLQDRLGEGGMGVVHLARDPEGRAVAVKVLHPLDPLGSEGVNARRRLAREVETMRRVRSPYVAEVLDADVTGEFPYIVTRFVAGPTLDEMVRTRGPLSSPGLRRLAHGMAEALTAIHAAGVVHRDLKPGNVMLTDDRPIVIDFGIAQAGDATRLTQTGLVMGTPGYLAPEVIEGEPSSPASDVHSWGSTMAFAATGHLPFGGGSYETIFYRIISGRADLSGVPAPLVPADFRGAGPGPLAPALGQLAQRPGHRARHVGAGAAPAAGHSGADTETQASPRGGDPSPPSRPPPRQRPRPVAAAPPAPKQAARDVADLLPPVSYPPATASSRNESSRTRIRLARGARRAPDPPLPRRRPPRPLRPPRARRPGRTPRPASPSWSRWWR